MINVKDVITLNDNIKYCVSAKTTYQDDIYYLIVDINNVKNFKICRERVDNGTIKLTVITDDSLIQKLILSFGKTIANDYKD